MGISVALGMEFLYGRKGTKYFVIPVIGFIRQLDGRVSVYFFTSLTSYILVTLS